MSALARIDTWPPPCAPKALLRAERRATVGVVRESARAIACLATNDHAGAARVGWSLGAWALALLAVAPLVSLLGGHPPRWRYPSRVARIAAKRARTQHEERRAQWESRGAQA